MLCDYISHCDNVSELQLRLYPKNLIQCTNTTNKKKNFHPKQTATNRILDTK